MGSGGGRAVWRRRGAERHPPLNGRLLEKENPQAQAGEDFLGSQDGGNCRGGAPCKGVGSGGHGLGARPIAADLRPSNPGGQEEHY